MKFEECIENNGYLIYTNVGGSMLPLLREGKDLMYIKKIDRPLKFFDSVLFRRPDVKGRGEYVLHRIIKIYDDDTYYICGDNCYTGERVKRENIFGLLTNVKRGKLEIDCAKWPYILYSYCWWATYPLRFMIHLVWMPIRRILVRCNILD